MFFSSLSLSVFSAREAFNCGSFVVLLLGFLLSKGWQGQIVSFPNPLLSVCIYVGIATRQNSNKGEWKRAEWVILIHNWIHKSIEREKKGDVGDAFYYQIKLNPKPVQTHSFRTLSICNERI